MFFLVVIYKQHKLQSKPQYTLHTRSSILCLYRQYRQYVQSCKPIYTEIATAQYNTIAFSFTVSLPLSLPIPPCANHPLSPYAPDQSTPRQHHYPPGKKSVWCGLPSQWVQWVCLETKDTSPACHDRSGPLRRRALGHVPLVCLLACLAGAR